MAHLPGDAAVTVARIDRAGRYALALLLGLRLMSGSAVAAPHEPLDGIEALDRETAVVLQRLADGRFDEASVLVQALVAKHPRFRLGQLLHAEMSSVQALDGLKLASPDGWSDELLDLLLEARTRLELAERPAAHAGIDTQARLPRALVQLGSDVADVLMVDLSRSELLHFRVHAGRATLARRHYVSSGSAGFGKLREGDLRTPLGVYRIRGLRPGSTLPDLYGAGALTLDYPNALDRQLGRTGSGIWLHGVPSANDSRAPWSSEGCVTMSNEHLSELVADIARHDTIVVLSDRIEWTDEADRLTLAATYRARLGVPADASLIEVPVRGPTQHVAVRETPSSDAPQAWEFRSLDDAPPLDATARVSSVEWFKLSEAPPLY